MCDEARNLFQQSVSRYLSENMVLSRLAANIQTTASFVSVPFLVPRGSDPALPSLVMGRCSRGRDCPLHRRGGFEGQSCCQASCQHHDVSEVVVQAPDRPGTQSSGPWISCQGGMDPPGPSLPCLTPLSLQSHPGMV